VTEGGVAAPRVVVMGVSGCGKSKVGALLAHGLELPFVEGDRLHSPRNVALMAAGTPLTDEDRRGWLDAVCAVLAAHAASGVVVACSALKRSYRDRLRAAAPGLRFAYLYGDPALLEARLARRVGHYMPASLLQSQLETLEPPSPDEAAACADVAAAPEAVVAALETQLRNEVA
jgi:carbohydrate kinase (thermoresistant glucokinase family)